MTPPTGDLARSLSSDAPVPAIDEDRFELLEEIGTGGMGSVYRAVQRSVGRYVAVKMLLPEHAASATGLSRFVREANVIARLTHPNIVQLIDFGRDRQGNLMRCCDARGASLPSGRWPSPRRCSRRSRPPTRPG